MRKLLIVVMIILCVGLGAGVVYLRQTADRQGPEIVFAGDKDTQYREDLTDEELLEGVTALDDADGDVTDSLTVENVYPRSDTEFVVVYVAKDNSNNVTKKEFVMEAGDGSSASNAKAETEPSEPEEEKALESDEDPEIANTEDTQPVDEEKAEEPEEEQPETELTPEEQAAQTEQKKIDELPEGAPVFTLTTYYIEVAKGTRVNPFSFVKNIEDDKEDSAELYKIIQIIGINSAGLIETSVEGTFETTYYVVDADGNESNHAVLTVVVK